MYQCYDNIRSFLLNTLTMLIDNLSSIHALRVAEEAANPTSKYNMSEPKHIFLLKTLYGMVDEMLSKNFLEDKRTN
jgi:hypothetical protein